MNKDPGTSRPNFVWYRSQRLYPTLILLVLLGLLIPFQNCGNPNLNLKAQTFSTDDDRVSIMPVYDIKIVPPGDNIFPNSSFESDPSNLFSTSASFVSENDDSFYEWADGGHTGERSISLKYSGSDPNYEAAWNLKSWEPQAMISVKEGQTYNFSVYITSFGLEGSAQLQVVFKNDRGQELSRTAGPSYLPQYEQPNPTSGCRRITFSAQAPLGSHFIHVEFKLKGPGQAFFDDFEVRQALRN